MHDDRTTVLRAPRAEVAPPAPPAVEELTAKLVADLIRRWRQGERPLPEEYLDRHPALRDHPEAAADLIYEELSLRQEFDEEVPPEEVLARFPQWRAQLEVLFDCQRVLGPRPAAPEFPSAGESVGDFLLLADLGRGAHGRVFLASQLSLADRAVVLKVTPLDAGEHLSLARLQHTHIVPLYSVHDDPARGLRALCMPYFGGATLDRVLAALEPIPAARRTGRDLLAALDRTQAVSSLAAPAQGPARQALAGAGYADAVCWIGACLADALQYAHERGLVHLDLKPSNVLLAADGQPMLLDFHLARAPIGTDEPGPPWLGGTAGYMSPEQQAAWQAAQSGRRLTRPLDGRSDQYALGLVLAQALAGADAPGEPLGGQPHVSPGLSDVLAKCLADNPRDRYPDLAALAADLRRHLAHLPLAGVRNRSLAERWRKWRRRRPAGAAVAGMMLAVLTSAAALALGALSHFSQRAGEARGALHDAQLQLARGQAEQAADSARRGLAVAHDLPWRRDLTAALDDLLRQAEAGRAAAARAEAARELHRLADRARLLYGAEQLPPETLQPLAEPCRALWRDVGRVTAHLGAAARDDLLDLAIFWADLQVRLAPPGAEADARRQALAVLDEAEVRFGPSPALDAERRRHGAAPTAAAAPAAATVWEEYALGRALLRAGDVDGAAAALERAVRRQPQGLWPNFYQGLCAYRRGRYADAVTAYSVCIGAAPEAAGCFYNRALALDALGRHEQAGLDYAEAHRLDPTLRAPPSRPLPARAQR